MIVWLIFSYVSLSSAISCYAGTHEFLQTNITLDKHECPERSSCFVYIYASNATDAANVTDSSQVDAYVKRGCLEEYEVPLFYSQVQCKQLLSLQSRLTVSELMDGQRCACTTDFCNSSHFYSFLFSLSVLLVWATW